MIVAKLAIEEFRKAWASRPKMDYPTIQFEATHDAIVEAYASPNTTGAPVEAEQEPRLLFLGSPGPENSPNGDGNGPSVVVAATTLEQRSQQPTNQAQQPSL